MAETAGKRIYTFVQHTWNFALRRSLHRLSERVYNAWQEVINHSSYHFIKELLRQAGDHMTSVRLLVCLSVASMVPTPPKYVATAAQMSYLHYKLYPKVSNELAQHQTGWCTQGCGGIPNILWSRDVRATVQMFRFYWTILQLVGKAGHFWH